MHFWWETLKVQSIPAVSVPCRPPRASAGCICNSWRTSVGHQRQTPLRLHTLVDPFSSEEMTLCY